MEFGGVFAVKRGFCSQFPGRVGSWSVPIVLSMTTTNGSFKRVSLDSEFWAKLPLSPAGKAQSVLGYGIAQIVQKNVLAVAVNPTRDDPEAVTHGLLE